MILALMAVRQEVNNFESSKTSSVRMAEWSKAPDSRVTFHIRVFWSTNVGVGSNPTSDKYFWFIKTIYLVGLLLKYHRD